MSEKLIVAFGDSSWQPHFFPTGGGDTEFFVVSPDGSRLACFMYVRGGWGRRYFAVVDGEEEKQYDIVAGASLKFSPDSKRVAYVARTRKKG
jgi:hypothetical protein